MKAIIPSVALILLIFASPIINAQTKVDMSKFSSASYRSDWEEISSLDKKRLPKSALAKVEAVVEKARRENNPSQLVKSLLHKAKYIEDTDESGRVASIQLLEKEVKDVIFPAKQVLHSILGSIYQKELSQRYWRIRNRTTLEEDKDQNDINLWTIDRFVQASTEHYLASLEEKEKLQSLPSDLFKAVLQEGKEDNGLRPTVFDFLTHRAIDHFMNDRNYLAQPKEPFLLNDPNLFGSAKDFAAHTFSSSDQTAYKYQALLLFQEILQAHLSSKNVKALVDVDIKRLKFAQKYAVLENADDQYLKALQSLQKKYDRHSVWGEISIAMADFYQSQGATYQAGEDDSHQWDLKKAHELCGKIIAREKDSYAAKRAKSLKKNIEISRLEATSEKVYLPQEPGLFLMQYRNTSKVYLKVVKVLQEETPDDYQEFVRKLAKTRPFRSWSYDLPDPGDFQEHRVEGAIPSLPIGQYAVVLSDNRRFDANKGNVSAIMIKVSSLAYVHQSGSPAEVLVVDRKTGSPLSNVKVLVYNYEYNRETRKSIRRLKLETKSNSDGLCELDLDIRGRYFIALEQGKDRLYLNDQSHYNYDRPTSYEPVKDRNLNMQFFLDRAIYRPGQTVYFKGLLAKKPKGEGLQVAANEKVVVTFKDVNYQEITKLTLTTNEYGTVNGRFEAPSTGLLGRMTLESEYGSISFRVEEYKRPKFSASFEPITEAYSLGDEVSVKGNAMGFAGNAVDGATVSYRVVREVSYPWVPWWYHNRYFPKDGERQEIIQGETKTDVEGNFVIKFKAVPDLSLDKKDKPAFTFRITADVVDITGETHTAAKRLKLANLGYETTVKLPEATDKSDQLSLSIDTRNLDGQFQAAEGTLQLIPIEAPENPTLDRYWETPDQWLIKEAQFRKQFPYFTYGLPKGKQAWPRKSPKLQQAVNSAEQKKWNIDISDWEVGHYLALFTVTDPAGNEIEASQAFFIYDRQTNSFPGDLSLWKAFTKEVYEPGEELGLQLATGFDQMSILLERQKGQASDRQWIKASPSGTYSYSVAEKDRGNLHFKGVAVRQNRVFQFEQNVSIPWSNKALQIEYHTFRDKLRPGEEEEWKIVVKGPEKEAVAAEVVAAMYDASLDEFASNSWSYMPHEYRFYGQGYWSPSGFNNGSSINVGRERNKMQQAPVRYYEQLNWFGFVENTMALRGRASSKRAAVPNASARSLEPPMTYESAAMIADDSAAPPPPPPPAPEEASAEFSPPEEGESGTEPAVRTNLNETVFFLPDLRTDKDGNVVIQFKMNEALTKWKFLLFAHTKEMEVATSSKTVQTQKELMVLPNAPRFLRETDEILYTAKVSNLSDSDLSGNAKLELFNAINREDVNTDFGLQNLSQDFSVKAGQSSLLSWKLKVPTNGMAAVVHRVTAQAGAFADGEESAIPVLSNRMLVTEAITLPLRAKESRSFTLESLKRSGQSQTLTHQGLSLEFTSNPAWYAVQSLPYLMEYPYKCTEQVFNRFYANTLAAGIVNQQPAIEQMFEQWTSPEAIESALSKNESLKQLLLEETPWVLNAQSEEEQRRNIALLFDLNRMKKEQALAAQQLLERQMDNGAYSWFPGGYESWYVTQYLLEGIGHLDQMQVLESSNDQTLSEITTKGLGYIDRAFQGHYKDLQEKIQNGSLKLEADHLSSIVIHYLYTRSLFELDDESGSEEEALGYYLGQAKQFWTKRGLYEQGMIALALHRYGEHEAALGIMRSLEERAIKSEELGMFWKYNRGWFWHELPIETHVLLLEAFAEVANDMVAVDEMKIWLLKNKQTNHWKTTKATAAAIHGLLTYGQNWLTETQDIKVNFPKASRKTYQPAIEKAQADKTPGVGYYKVDFDAKKVSKDFATIKVKNPNDHIVWGGLYWQYFEDLDAIKTFEETPLKLKKQLFLVTYNDAGEVLQAVDENYKLKPGEKIKVRIELKVDRDMEFIHMKDMRASGLEPINVLSRYKWQDGLGYYESTKDVATHFFFDYLPKGAYVFEYPLRVVHEGQFSNGVTTIQSMYAPEFTSHSEGINIEIQR